MKKLKEFAKNKKVLYGLGGTLGLAACVGLGVVAAPMFAGKSGHGEDTSHERVSLEKQPTHEEHASAEKQPTHEEHAAVEEHASAEEHHSKPGVVDRTVAAFKSIQAKAQAIHRAEEENKRLRLENSNLRLQLETVQLDCRNREAVAHARNTHSQLSDEAWSAVARTKASIRYEIPTHLLAPQLYTLAVTYFKAGENEKAAILLTHLTGLAENPTYKDSKNYLMTGVAWYRLDNLKLADSYFDLAMKEKGSKVDLQYHAQARLWKALVAERTDKHLKAQFWLRDLIDHHPQSTEAAWINSKEMKGERGIASEKR